MRSMPRLICHLLILLHQPPSQDATIASMQQTPQAKAGPGPGASRKYVISSESEDEDIFTGPNSNNRRPAPASTASTQGPQKKVTTDAYLHDSVR